MQIRYARKIGAFLVVTLGACSTTSPTLVTAPSFSLENTLLFGAQPELISEGQLHQLGPLQERAFLNYFNDPSRSDQSAHLRVADYLHTKGDQLRYRDEVLTAEQILQFGRGNCFAAPILTTAFAKLAGIESHYRSGESYAVAAPYVRSVLIPASSSGITPDNRSIFRETYTMAVSRSPTQANLDNVSYSDFSAGESAFHVNFFPQECLGQPGQSIRDITYDEYLATFYLYMAGAAFANQDYVQAYWLNRQSIELDPDNSSAYHNMAAIHRQLGDDTKAELIYQYGIEHLEKLVFLESYQSFLRSQGRVDEAEALSLDESMR